MSLVQRVPYDPDAVDISAIQRREQLKIWNRRRQEPPSENKPFWRSWLART